MQPQILIFATVDQLEEARETRFLDHAGVCRLIGMAIEQQKEYDNVQRCWVILLQQTVDDLGADVVLVVSKQLALQ